MIKTKTIIILSGGMDSSTLLHFLLAQGKEVKALSFDYNQKHKRELEMAKKQCEILGIEHKVIDLSFYRELASNSALTSDMAVPEGHYAAENMKLTVVPNRNLVMLSIAIGWAVNIDYDEVAIGVHAGDFDVYPDCRPEFIEKVNAIAQIANFKPISIYAPFLNATKGDIAVIGKRFGVPYQYSVTCYAGKELACGRCGSCVERILAMNKAGMIDPIEYEKPWEEVLADAKNVVKE